MLLKTLCVALLLAVGEGGEATSEVSAAAKKECPCQGDGACTGGQCSKVSACGAACSKTVAAVDEACEGCDEAIAAVDKACIACAKVFAAWEKVAVDDEPCCGECSKCSKCCAKATKVVANDEACCGECSTCSKCSALTVKAGAKCCAEGRVKDAAVAPASAVVAIDAAQADAQELLRQKLAERDTLQREIDELSAATQSWQQVLVRVKVMEVNLTKMRKQGVELASFGIVDQFQIFKDDASGNLAAYTREASGDAHPQPPCGAAGTCKKPTSTAWEALEQKNLARVIAEPTLVTVSGRPASFNVGGEVPIPTRAGAPNACDFLHFGTKLDVLAIAMGDNKVRLEIKPRISEIRDDRTMVADENGNKIPSLQVTEIDTACELEFGETWALSGLITRRTEAKRTDDGVQEEHQDVMLLIVVTPEAVGPRVAQRVSTIK